MKRLKSLQYAVIPSSKPLTVEEKTKKSQADTLNNLRAQDFLSD